MAKPITVEGTGGARFEVDPDLPWVQQQLERGDLTKVQATRSGRGKPDGGDGGE